MDPFLKDLDENKQVIRRKVMSLASKFKDVSHQLSSREQYFVHENLARQAAEVKAKRMEEEVTRLQQSLEERNRQLQSSSEKHLKELDDMRLQLCVPRMKEHKLAEQLDLLQKNLQSREISQKQLKDEAVRVEHHINQALAKVGVNNDSELRKILDDASLRNFEIMNKMLSSKDEEICIMSAHWKFKTNELKSQLEKKLRDEQELKKEVLKLEFSLKMACSQTRRTGDRRDKALKESREQLAAMDQQNGSVKKPNLFGTYGFEIVASMSMLVLVMFTK